MGDKLPGSKYGFEMVDGNREPFYLKMTDFIMDLKHLILLLPKEGLIWKQYETKRLVDKICERLKNSEIKTKLLMIKELVEKRQIGAAQKMINDLHNDPNLERMIDESLGTYEPTETHKSHFNFKKWATIGIAGIIGAVTFGHYKPAFAEVRALGNGTNVQVICNNNSCYSSDDPSHVFSGIGNVVKDPRTGKVYLGPQSQNNGNRASDQSSQEYSQPKQAPPSVPHKHYNFKTANDYIKAADKAYKRHDYNEIINLSEDALNRINNKEIKATTPDVIKLNHARDIGYSNK